MRLTCVPLIIIMASTVIMNPVCHVKIKWIPLRWCYRLCFDMLLVPQKLSSLTDTFDLFMVTTRYGCSDTHDENGCTWRQFIENKKIKTKNVDKGKRLKEKTWLLSASYKTKISKRKNILKLPNIHCLLLFE